MRQLTVNKNDAGQRVDKFMSKTFPTMPQSLLYKYLRNKCVRVNGVHVKENAMLHEGDTITFYISDEFFGVKPSVAVTNASADVSVCYEDANILIVRKEKGVLCHSEEPDDTDTLVDRVKAYLRSKGEYAPEKENSFAPALCNRIDRNTEGLVIAAKSAEALRIMNEIIRNREIHKTYLAAVHGFFSEKKGEMISYLEKNADENRVYVRSAKSKSTVTAVLEYEVVSENKERGLSLLKISLKTGRTHQIRAQMADAGHPLLGDGKYAVNKDDRKSGFSSQALCSWSVSFDFASDYGILNYLNGMTVKTDKPAFVKLFY